MVATLFAFLQAIQPSQVSLQLKRYSTSVVSLPTPGKAKIQAPVFLLWEEPKVSDIPRKPVGKRCVSQSKYGASEDYQ